MLSTYTRDIAYILERAPQAAGAIDEHQVYLDLVHDLVYPFLRGFTMIEVNVHEAKTHLSRLLARVASGEEIVIAKAGKPVALLVPFHRAKGKRPLGSDRGRFVVPDDFNAPLPEEVLEAFEGET